MRHQQERGLCLSKKTVQDLNTVQEKDEPKKGGDRAPKPKEGGTTQVPYYC